MMHFVKMVVKGCMQRYQSIVQPKKTIFRASRDKGCQYLLAKQRPDGSFGDPQKGVKGYFKILMAFHACGFTKEAHQLCQWIRSSGMTVDGNFCPRPQGKQEYGYIYPNSWIIIGAHQLGAFDISQRGMDFLLTFHDQKSGGFYSSRLEREASTKQDLIYVGFAGLAALYTGRIDIARGVGCWMKTLLNIQPTFPEELYTVYNREQGLCTQYDSKEISRYFLSGTATTGDQPFFQVGVAGGFLSELFLATGENDWLNLAMQYMQFAEMAHDHLYRSVRAGKVGWAASLLYSLTGERKYQEMANRVGDFLVSYQAEGVGVSPIPFFVW